MNPDEMAIRHPKRKLLYKAITETPGISFRDLLDMVECSESTLQYHLGYLQRKDIIKKEMKKGNRCYYCRGQRVEADEQLLSQEHINRLQKLILEVVEEVPGINQKELSIRTRTNRFLLSYHMNRLIELGYISKEREGRNIRYFRQDEIELKRKLLLKIVDELLDGKLDEETYNNLKRELDRDYSN